jgi:hypothetical protein
MATERTFSSAFGQMAITNEPIMLMGVKSGTDADHIHAYAASMKYGLWMNNSKHSNGAD